MSYVLQVWQQPDILPLPGDLGGALALVDRLQSEPPRAPERFRAFAAQLTQRHPCMCSPQAEHMPEERLAWSEGPLDGDTDSAVYGIGLRSSMVDEVLPFVVQTAAALGLNVWDDQAARCYLNNGKVLSDGAAPGAAPLQDREVLLDMLAARLDPVLAAQGLVPDPVRSHFRSARTIERQYRQVFQGGRHTLRLAVAARDGHLAWSVQVGSRLDRIGQAAAYFEFGSQQPAHALELQTMVLDQEAWLQPEVLPGVELDVDKAYVVRTRADAERSLDDLAAQMKRRLFSILSLFKSVRGISILLNTQPLSQSFYYRGYNECTPNVLAAYYARDPQLEALCTGLLERTRDMTPVNDYAAAQLDKLRRCIAHVRNNPLPE